MAMVRVLGLLVVLLLGLTSCKSTQPAGELIKGETFAELRAVKGSIVVTPPDKSARAPYPRERLVDGERVEIAAGGLGWMRRDGGATWLLSGPAKLRFRAQSVELTRGRAFVDSEHGDPVSIETPRGQLELSDARASVEVGGDGNVSVYVLRGTARASGSERVVAGERLTLAKNGKTEKKPVVSWEDWTGGLGTADPAAQAAPFGIGTIGARKPGDKGKPRFSLVIERMDVKVTIDRDFALTEVDQTFVNPSSDTVEGIFSFRTPERAVLQRFGVDRHGEVIWGRVKEQKAALRQYESNVYEGSEEDPALLTWTAPGVYNARLYPIKPGAKRRVVTRYTEWLSRQGPRGERRMYVYPMAAEGTAASLPRIEELTVTLDLGKARAKSVRSGMGGKKKGDKVVVKAFDFVPRADLAVELFDDPEPYLMGYRAPHGMTEEDAPEEADDDFASKVSAAESDYVAIPLRAPPMKQDDGALDLAIVIDTSAATEPSALAIARTMASSLLAHLGPRDRAALWAGDASLRPVARDSGALIRVDAERRKAWLAGLAKIERGGATDIGALLTDAASKLDPKRRGAVVYVGDGSPSVGELAPKSLRERMARLPQTTRLLVAAVGSQPNVALLQSLARGAGAELVHDGYSAARSALRLLEAAGRPLWLGAKIDLGPNVERVLPKTLPPVSPDETVLVVGRLTGVQPTKLVLTGSGGVSERSLHIRRLKDAGDLRRRWGEERLRELMADGAGRASLVDLGRRFGLVSPFTALYVPTERESASEERDEAMTYAERREQKARWKPWSSSWTLGEDHIESINLASRRPSKYEFEQDADNKEGGTGTRAKGEEGSMGKAEPKSTNKRYAVQGPKDNPDPHLARQQALREAQEFGMIGKLDSGAMGSPGRAAPEPAPPVDAAPKPASEAPVEEEEADKADLSALSGAKRVLEKKTTASRPSSAVARRVSPRRAVSAKRKAAGGAGGLGLSGIGQGGGGTARGSGAGQGFGAGHGRLGGSHRSRVPKVRMQTTQVTGALPSEVIQRIVRQNFGRFRTCYERGLARNPDLEGRVVTRFFIDAQGNVTRAFNDDSDLPDVEVVECVVRAYHFLSFPAPEAGEVTVVFPLAFEPGEGDDDSESEQEKAIEPDVAVTALARVGHEPRPCGPGADLPLEERIVLWRERLAGKTSAEYGLDIYRSALSWCEATNWRERSLLLVQIVNQMGSISDQVTLWRALLKVSPTAADAVFRLMLLRVQTAADLRSLHEALGLERIEPELLEALLKKAESPGERLTLLRGAAERFGDDTELALLVLEAYEDAKDDAGGRAWARKLRRRVDASSHVRTSVGEYYLRLAGKASGEAGQRDADEARRTFGEIVEFAPEDPLARRRLGDLLRAHGWYAEAMRQYETLQELTPDDPSVPLLLASAAQGMGKTEKAVRWLEKAAGTAAPDAHSPVALAARALASAFLAWSREASAKAKKSDEVERLRNRAARLASAESGRGVRVIMTWAHPELRAALWTNALGSMMPAPDNLPLLGVAQANVPSEPTPLIEVRLDREDAERAARLDLRAALTLIVGEGTKDERIVTREVGFRDPEGKPVERVRLRFENGVLREEVEQ